MGRARPPLDGRIGKLKSALSARLAVDQSPSLLNMSFAIWTFMATLLHRVVLLSSSCLPTFHARRVATSSSSWYFTTVTRKPPAKIARIWGSSTTAWAASGSTPSEFGAVAETPTAGARSARSF